MLSTILPQAVAGSVVIVDAQKNTSELQAAQDTFAESSPSSYAGQSALSFETPSPAAESIAELQTPATFAGNALHAPAEPVYFQAQEEFEAQPAAAEESKESFFFQTETQPEADYRPQADGPDSDYAAYLEAAQKFDSEYAQEVQIEEPFATSYAPVEEQFEVPSRHSEEASQPALQQLGLNNPPPKPLAYLDQLEHEPEMPKAGANFVVAPEFHQPPVQDAAPQPFYAAEPASRPFETPQAPQSVHQPNLPAPQDLPYAWDNSVDNYPVLMVQEERRVLSKPLLALAAMALLAFAAAGYWFVFKPFFGGASPEAPQRASKTVENNQPTAPPSQPEKTPESTAAAPQPPASAAVTPPEQSTPTPDAAPASQPEPNGQGKISLQAASFPSEQAANEFSEKLIRSGVPAYIASANIAGKGKWYRVRVGRFVSPAEAEKYAAQAKQRAKASGLNLQLVVCDYSNQ